MDLKDFKVKGDVLLDSHSCEHAPTLIRNRTIKVTGTPLGLMTGEFQYLGCIRHCVKAEGEDFTLWYQVGCSFPALPKPRVI